MSDEELTQPREQLWAQADDFHKSRVSYEEIIEKDIRDWGDEGLTEVYLGRIRDRLSGIGFEDTMTGKVWALATSTPTSIQKRIHFVFKKERSGPWRTEP